MSKKSKPSVAERYKTAVERLRFAKLAAGLQEPEPDYRGDRDPDGERYRARVFAVPDLEKRKELIRATIECEKAFIAREEQEQCERAKLIKNHVKDHRQNVVLTGAGLGMPAVAAAHWLLSAPFAHAVTALLILLGVVTIENATDAARERVEQAKQEYEEARAYMGEWGEDPPTFTEAEAERGEPSRRGATPVSARDRAG